MNLGWITLPGCSVESDIKCALNLIFIDNTLKNPKVKKIFVMKDGALSS